MMKMRLISCALLGVFLGSTAMARGGGSGILFDANLFYTSTKAETTNQGSTNATVNADSTNAIYDIKLGYLSDSGLYFGGIYTSRSDSLLNQSGSSGSATGASLGYMADSGLFVHAHYLVSAKMGVYSEGTGYQADFGYKASMGSGWLLGAELTYRSMSYKKSTSNSNLETYKLTEVLPMISIGFIF